MTTIGVFDLSIGRSLDLVRLSAYTLDGKAGFCEKNSVEVAVAVPVSEKGESGNGWMEQRKSGWMKSN